MEIGAKRLQYGTDYAAEPVHLGLPLTLTCSKIVIESFTNYMPLEAMMLASEATLGTVQLGRPRVIASINAKSESGLSGRSVLVSEAIAKGCAINARESEAEGNPWDARHWAARAESANRSAAFLRGESVDTVALALVVTDLRVSYAHVICENPRASDVFTIPECGCEYTHSYAFKAFDLGHLVSVNVALFFK